MAVYKYVNKKKMIILAIVSLFVPLLWELWSDRNGETAEDKIDDVLWRIGFIFLAGLINLLIHKPIVDSMFLALAIHWFFFDYIITWWLIKEGVVETNKSWFEYLGKYSVMDNFRIWI